MLKSSASAGAAANTVAVSMALKMERFFIVPPAEINSRVSTRNHDVVAPIANVQSENGFRGIGERIHIGRRKGAADTQMRGVRIGHDYLLAVVAVEFLRGRRKLGVFE